MTEKKTEFTEETVELTEVELSEASGGVGYLKIGDIKGESRAIKTPIPETGIKTYPKIGFPNIKARGD